MSSNFQLDVKPNEGLSYAIDRALDAEFGQDIQLKKSIQWQSIFNIITADQAEQAQANQKQFSSTDNDVKNNKHYQVNEGKYYITQNAWNNIVAFVQQELNLATPQKQQAAAIEEQQASEEQQTSGEQTPTASQQPETQEKSNEEKLTAIIQKENIQLNEEEYLDVLSKYENKLALKAGGLDITDETIESDILAYIHGKKYEKKEDLFYAQHQENVLPDDPSDTVESYTLDGVKKAVEYSKQNPDDLEEAYRLNAEGYKQFGNAQLQLYDSSGENLVDFNEFLQYEQQRTNENYGIEERTAAKKVFDYIDMNNDGNIDLKEMTIHGFAMSKITDDANTRTGDTISYNDWWTTQVTLAGVGTDDQASSYVKAKERYQQLRELGEETIYNYEKHIK